MDESIQNSNTHEQMHQLPSVQLIGAQKAGTSAIANWLFEGEGGFCRPRVFEDEPWYYNKEVHFFDLDHRYSKGPEFYAKRFIGRHGRFMDATPDTLAFAERVRSIYEEAGGGQVKSVKIIVILREPVSRELSLYNHLAFECRRLGAADSGANIPGGYEWHRQAERADGSILSFDEFVFERSVPAFGREDGPGRSTRHGMYAIHLEKWFNLFDRDQILVLSYDELKKNPEKQQERIQE